MSRPRRALRASSALALVLCVFAQLAGSVHSATVRHVACREHGGVVELHGDGSPSPRVAHAAVVAGDEDAHHAHCDRCATATAQINTAHASDVARIALIATNEISAAAVVDDPIARLHLAPKGSPPPLPTI